jgi:hypothetical protein
MTALLASDIEAAPSVERAALARRIADAPWDSIGDTLDAEGVATLPGLLTKTETQRLAANYDEPARFRSRVIMQRHQFGRGEYQYFAYPLPPLVQALREDLYTALAPHANRWAERLDGSTSRIAEPAFPQDLDEFLRRCHAAGQRRPTPLLLRYGEGDYNCLHQDLYGDNVFPLQVVILLSEPGRDFDGGEFVLVEQRPRAQSAARVVALRAGDAAIIATHHRPQRGVRGWHRVTLRHGVSRVLRGRRFTAGIIFHDAAAPSGEMLSG